MVSRMENEEERQNYGSNSRRPGRGLNMKVLLRRMSVLVDRNLSVKKSRLLAGESGGGREEIDFSICALSHQA